MVKNLFAVFENYLLHGQKLSHDGGNFDVGGKKKLIAAWTKTSVKKFSRSMTRGGRKISRGGRISRGVIEKLVAVVD